MEIIKRPTVEEYIEHLKVGTDKCLVCTASPLGGGWTDYNGQLRCFLCGMTYQILGSHLTEELLKEYGLTKDMIAKKYCDAFMELPLVKAYWDETKQRIPFGMYLGDSPITKDERDGFYGWVAKNAATIRPEFGDAFNWDKLLEHYGG